MADVDKINLIIPAAGVGTRLGKYTKSKSKNMVFIDKKTIFEHQIKSFNFKFINKLIFITGYKKDYLKKYVNKLRLPIKIYYLFNRRFKMTQCANSLVIALKKFKDNAIILNSDLIFDKTSINYVLKNKNKNFLFIRNKKNNFKSRPVKILYKNKKIINIGIGIENFNYDVVGPIIFQKEAIIEILKKIKKKKRKYLDNISCYEIINLIKDKFKFNCKIIKDKKWHEINTINDLQIFKKKQRVN